MRLSTGRNETSLVWTHAVLSFGRLLYCTCSQPSGPWSFTDRIRGTCSTVGFGRSSTWLPSGASYRAMSGTITSAASKACSGGGAVVVVVDVDVVVVEAVVVGAAATFESCLGQARTAAA